MVSFMAIIQSSLVYTRTTYSAHCSFNKTPAIVERGPFIIGNISKINALGVVATASFVEMFLRDDPNYWIKSPTQDLRSYVTGVLVEQICAWYNDICRKLQQNHKLLHYNTWKHQVIVKYLPGVLYRQEEISAYFCTHLDSKNLGKNFRSSSMVSCG